MAGEITLAKRHLMVELVRSLLLNSTSNTLYLRVQEATVWQDTMSFAESNQFRCMVKAPDHVSSERMYFNTTVAHSKLVNWDSKMPLTAEEEHMAKELTEAIIEKYRDKYLSRLSPTFRELPVAAPLDEVTTRLAIENDWFDLETCSTGTGPYWLLPTVVDT